AVWSHLCCVVYGVRAPTEHPRAALTATAEGDHRSREVRKTTRIRVEWGDCPQLATECWPRGERTTRPARRCGRARPHQGGSDQTSQLPAMLWRPISQLATSMWCRRSLRMSCSFGLDEIVLESKPYRRLAYTRRRSWRPVNPCRIRFTY